MYKKYAQHRFLAFTLIEILVVIAIIGILAAIGLGSYGSAQSKARDARRKNDLANIARALEMYYNDTGDYPTYRQAGDYCATPCIIRARDALNNLVDVPWGGIFQEKGEIYMQALPTDPRNSQYNYVHWENGAGTISYKGYWLFARLENLEDGSPNFARMSDGTPAIWNFAPTATWTPTCGDGGCNYYISSPNAPRLTAIPETP